jgi:hypothetical protein
MNDVSVTLARNLAKEVVKDMHPNDVYFFAEEAMSRRFMRKYNLEALREEYEERYDYIFMAEDDK